jgi:hypothetical protein
MLLIFGKVKSVSENQNASRCDGLARRAVCAWRVCVASVTVDHNPQAVEGGVAGLYNLGGSVPGLVCARHAIGGQMVGKTVRLVGVAAMHLLLATGLASAQSSSPEALAAAKELVETVHLTEQYKAILPGIFKAIKPSIVQGRAEVDKQYDALVPMMEEAFKARVSEMIDAAAIVYAKNFSADDLHALNEFYKTSAGQRLLQKLPVVSQELLSAGTKFGQSVGRDLQQRMIEELRKKGVNL